MRRPLVVLFAVAAALPGSASPRTGDGAGYVRSAIPAIDVYYADHGTYVGLTVKAIRSIDPSVKHVSVRRATKARYCVQSTAGGTYHFDGPQGPLRTGPCGRRGAAVPPSPPPPVTPGTEASSAMANLRGAFVAIEVYHYEHKTYVGMTVAKLRRIDAGLENIVIVRAMKNRYCIESTVGSTTYHLDGPGGSPAAGGCS